MTANEQAMLAEEYYLILDKPAEAKRKPQFALCMIGLVGAGKSTVLKKICQYISMVRVSGDEVRKMVYDKGLSAIDSHEVADISARAIRRLNDEGYRVAYDNDFGNPAIRRPMEEYNQARGIPIIWIRVAPSEKFIKDKLTAYDHTYLFRDADHALEVYSERKALHESDAAALSSLPYVYTFDTSASDLEGQVRDAVEIMNLRLKAMKV